MKKKILGKSDAWSTNHLSHRPSKSPCSIVDCRIFGEQTDKLKLIWLAVFTTLIPNFTAMYGRTPEGRSRAGLCLLAKMARLV